MLWRADRWQRIDAGRVVLVSKGPQRWDAGRSATWVTVRDATGVTMSLVSVHHMINPGKFGPAKPLRQQLYGQGMDTLVGLVGGLSERGPVFVAGDMNTHASQRGAPWSAAAKMAAAGYGWVDRNVDFIYYNQQLGITPVGSWAGSMVSDHDWIAARFAMNGAGPSRPGYAAAVAGGTGPAVACVPAPGGVIPAGAGPVNGSWPAEACSVVPDPSTGTGCLTPRTRTVLQAVKAMPHLSVSCWDPRAWNPSSDHPRGKACDVFFDRAGILPFPAGKAEGDTLAQFFIDRAGEYGINYLIWYGRIWRSRTGAWGPYNGGGVYNPADVTGGHFDHVHLSVF